MCRRVTCQNCGKATWAGCGEHIEEALAGVPQGERCDGKCAPAPAKSGFSLFRRRA
jgi:hypothetical protein